MKTVYFYLILLLVAGATPIVASAEDSAKSAREPRYIVDMPTAGIIPKGSFSAYTVFSDGGGVMAELSAAPLKDFNMGICYSGSNVIGGGQVTWQNYPGIHLRYRILNETPNVPAVLIGVSTQGRGIFSADEKRFTTLSPGFFASVSKSFNWFLGGLALHGGVNYSFEPPSSQKSINVYVGVEQTLASVFSVSIEYNPTLDDGNKQFLSEKGLLNASFKWMLDKNFVLELQARDLLAHYASYSSFTRWLALEYVTTF